MDDIQFAQFASKLRQRWPEKPRYQNLDGFTINIENKLEMDKGGTVTMYTRLRETGTGTVATTTYILNLNSRYLWTHAEYRSYLQRHRAGVAVIRKIPTRSAVICRMVALRTSRTGRLIFCRLVLLTRLR